jgi:hypothetical protein
MRWPWTKRKDPPPDEELRWAKRKTLDLSQRVERIAQQNNLAREIRKALGA